ncbi:MAG TPA: hemolysin III family protein [bacterium]|nr:hemolysin III family protein [bacterium]HMW34009.1 hemolysin III family protein [bacterium]HMW34809.1 hemolysin III family protein [bacterium]HMY35292.1 hemolysin III family protein [bacterium]HMZ03192.1 hemolysin III family protein [bacterium]
MKSITDQPEYSFGEELAHAITHGIGAILSIAGLTLLVAFSALRGDAWHVVSSAIFGTTLVLLYSASTLYHSFPQPKVKRIFRIMDHSAIYLLIAGTYTPFLLVSLRGAWGWTLFGVVWSAAIAGVWFKVFHTGRFPKLSTTLYIVMGWVALVAVKPMMENIPLGGLILILAGGLTYTVGVVFYVMHRMIYHHAVWHLFVLGGSILHFFAVLLYVIP